MLDTISLASGTADIFTRGNDVIFNGKITVTGSAGNDTIEGGDGDDVFVYLGENKIKKNPSSCCRRNLAEENIFIR